MTLMLVLFKSVRQLYPYIYDMLMVIVMLRNVVAPLIHLPFCFNSDVDIDVDDRVEVYDDDEVAVEEGCSLLDACIFVLATFVQNPFIPFSCS